VADEAVTVAAVAAVRAELTVAAMELTQAAKTVVALQVKQGKSRCNITAGGQGSSCPGGSSSSNSSRATGVEDNKSSGKRQWQNLKQWQRQEGRSEQQPR
jgi:hypothetical protein